MNRAPQAAASEARIADFVRSNEALRDEIMRVRANFEALSAQFAAVVSGSESDRESRRAALNLMEDAVLARRAEQQENDVRRRVEAELREANARQDDLLVTLRASERALQRAAARQALVLELTDRIREVAEPAEIMGITTEVLAGYLGDAATHFAVVDAAGRAAVVVAAHASGPLGALAEGARVPLADWPEGVAFLARGEVARIAEDDPAAPCILLGRPTGTGPRYAVAVPLMNSGRLVAILVTACIDPRIWMDETIHLQREIAERAWNAVERAAAISELRASYAERAHLLARARAGQAQAEEASRTKDEFLATLSHELRTPLAAILLWAGVLQAEGGSRREVDRAARAIMESAESQSHLIEELLDLSRLTAGKVRLVRAAVEVGALVRATVEVVRPAASAKGLSLDLSIDVPLGDAWLDPARLKQVLWNLLANATKFTPAGGTIAVGAQRRDGRLEIQVSDDGEGIAPEFMPHIFERFRQADAGESRAYAGLGIGLALSRQLVDLHGGSILAASEGRGRGAIFRISLPWIDPPPPAPATSPAAALAPSATKSLAGVTVLLVEDDAPTSAAMAQVLERAGAAVRASSTARDALAAIDAMSASERRSFVLVSDLGLPGMSGFELIEHILARTETSSRAVPACAISARIRHADRERALEAGFDLFVPKPVSPQQLVDAVRDLRDIGVRA